MSQKTPPRTLYRYVSSIERVKELVGKNLLSFAHPTTFNDPFDCKTLFDYESATKEEVKPFLSMAYGESRPGKSGKDIVSVVDLFLKNWPNGIHRIREFENDIRDPINTSVAVCCFSETKEDILMWSHYADGHKGFCLEFDMEALSGEGPEAGFKLYPVDYREKYPHVREFGSGLDGLTKVLLLSKSKQHWEYEKEWRTLIDRTGVPGDHFPVEIPSTALIGIIFGCSCPEEQIEWVRTFVKESGKRIKLYRAEKSTTSYAVDIREMGNE